MMFRTALFHWVSLATIVAGLAGTARAADEYQLATLDEPPSGEPIGEGVIASLQETGISVKRGNRVLCNLWLAKKWSSVADFKPTLAVQYPFTPGQFMGIVEFKRTGGDFRGQEIAAGVYTVRYAQQPVDGNHVGTSETRDFWLLLPAEKDSAAADISPETLVELSKEAAQSNHPCMLCLLKPDAEPGKAPRLEHEESHDWWMLNTAGNRSDWGMLPIRLVIVGKAAE